MPARGPRLKPDALRRRRNNPSSEWTEVEAVPHIGGPALPKHRPGALPWPAATRQWWDVLRSMPHAKLWAESDWLFATDTAVLHASYIEGDLRLAAELRHRSRTLGLTADARAALRIRYVEEDQVGPVSSPVASIEDYRASLD